MNACVFPRDLYFLCSLVPTSDHIIKRTLHGCLKMWVLFSRVENIFYSLAALVRIYFFLLLHNNIRIFAPPCNIYVLIVVITVKRLSMK